MKKITLLLSMIISYIGVSGQVVLIRENFQNWSAQAIADNYSITKKLFDGTTDGTFTGTLLKVEPTNSIGSAGTAVGNGSPTQGRIIIAGITSCLTLPLLPTIGTVNIKMNPGTTPNGYKLQVFDGISSWTDIPGTATAGDKLITKLYTHNLTYTSPTQIRIIANQSGSVNIWDVEVYSNPTALPKLDPPTVGVASNIGTNGFTANWSTVANASGGYNVKVYEGATLANTTLATGQATASALITGLKTGTTYTYTVTAIGDAANYDSSDPSTVSTSFTTLGLSVPVVGAPTDITANSFTANWTPVANASSYNVLLYLTTNLVITTNIEGQSASSLSLSGLTMGTTYTYKVLAVGDGVNFINSDASSASSIAKTTAVTISQLNPNFADGTWGGVVSGSLSLGTFPTYSANGFDLTKGYIQTTNINGLKGEAFTHMLKLDKTSNSGVMDLPTVASVAQLEIHASATTGRQFTLSVWNSGTSAWDLYGTYATTVDTENIFLINFPSVLTNAKFRIVNISSGAYSFYKIKTHTTQPVALTAPTVGAASNIGITGFTANWTSSEANATGYKVCVYKGTSLMTTVEASGQSTNSVAITGLQADSVYTYKVGALGDGDASYSNSLLSAASASITTLSDLGTFTKNIYSTSFITIKDKIIFTSEIGNIEIYNLQGVKIVEERNTNKVDVNNINGLYFVRFKTGNESEKTQKIIIK